MSKPLKKDDDQPDAKKQNGLTHHLRAAIARLKGHAPPVEQEPLPSSSQPFPISDIITKDTLRSFQIGQDVPGKGIFFGVWKPTDRDGESLGKVFNLFAAPEDLPSKHRPEKTFNYEQAIEAVRKLKNWHGHDGECFSSDTKLYDAIRNDTYTGGWFIPTIDILVGQDQNGHETKPGLYQHRFIGSLKDSFRTAQNKNFTAHWYWSCTEIYKGPAFILNAAFSDGRIEKGNKSLHQFSLRLVRIEPRP